MKTIEWITLISFIWVCLSVGLLITTVEFAKHSEEKREVLERLHPFFRGRKMAINAVTKSDFLWIDRLSTRQQQAILAYVRKHPTAEIKDLMEVATIKTKTMQKLDRYFY